MIDFFLKPLLVVLGIGLGITGISAVCLVLAIIAVVANNWINDWFND